MFLPSWEQGDNGAKQQRLFQYHEKQTSGDPGRNEKVGFQGQYDLLRGVRCRHHTSECRCIKRRAWLYRARWCVLILPLLWILGRPRKFPHEKTCSSIPSGPLVHQQEPIYAMSNYSASALQPHIAYGASNAHGIAVHTDIVVPNASCKYFPRRSPVGLCLTSIAVVPVTFQPLPLGSIKSEGWLHDQLSLMSDGLAGHEYDFYHYVHDSSWLGGHSEYSSLNEGFPYWFNGLVALAYGLDDARLKTQVLNAASYVQQHQQPDGWLGPETTNSTRDLWGRFPYFLGLYQLVEADPTQTNTIIPAMYKFINLMHGMLIENIGFTQFWGQVRYQDMLITLQWLYENHPVDNGRDNKQLLIETMYLLKQRSYDWSEYYNKDVFIFEDLDLIQPPITGDSAIFPFVHGVNTGQGMHPMSDRNPARQPSDTSKQVSKQTLWSSKLFVPTSLQPFTC